MKNSKIFKFILSLSIVFATMQVASASIGQFVGTWKNVRPNKGVTKLVINKNGKDLMVQAWGACTPTDCDWGKVDGYAYGPNVSANLQKTASAITAIFKESFSKRIVVVKPKHRSKKNRLQVTVYTRFTDSSSRTNYTNVFNFVRVRANGNCSKKIPKPRIKYKRRDAKGRVYIPVINYSSYPNYLFKSAPKLPPCGKNKKSSRTWVDINDAKTNKRIYGFCALNSNTGLQKIWFYSKAKSGKVYIIINDRKCKKKYKSNTITWGIKR